MELKAVVFDMDGILIDSEPVYMERERLFMKHIGVDVTQKQLSQLVGSTSAKCREMLYDWSGQSCGMDAFMVDYRQFAQTLGPVNYPDIMFPDVPSVLSELSAYVPLAVASSSPMDNIRTVLDVCGIAHVFQCTVSGEQFSESKPNPEIYLHTAKKLGLQPGQCLAVEDSSLGIAAARAAGYYVVARREERFSFDQSEAHIIIDSLTELSPIVRKMQSV